MLSNNHNIQNCTGCAKGLPACTCDQGAHSRSTGLTSNMTHSHGSSHLGTSSSLSSGSHAVLHQTHLGQGNLKSATCNICLGTEVLQSQTPIIQRIEEKPVVITHHEGQVFQAHEGGVQIKTHQEAPIIKQHIEKPIIKEVHQNVIHEHHKDIIHEHRQQVVHEHHQPVIHEVHQPIIHEKHVHEIHQPIIHEKHQTLIQEQHKPVIHEESRHLVHEQQRAAVVHEHTKEAVIHCNKEAAPIVKTENLGTTNLGTTNLGTTHTHSTGLGHTHGDVRMKSPDSSPDSPSRPKRSFGQKIKQVFSGNNSHTHSQGNTLDNTGTLQKHL